MWEMKYIRSSFVRTKPDMTERMVSVEFQLENIYIMGYIACYGSFMHFITSPMGVATDGTPPRLVINH